MKSCTPCAWLSPLARYASCFIICIVLAACSIYGGGGKLPFEPEILKPLSEQQYFDRLADIQPLRFEKRWHIDTSEPGIAHRQVVREFHMLRDTREPKNDALMIVLDNMRMLSVSAREFTVLWKGLLERRTMFDPVFTNNSIFFIDEQGDYQQFDRFYGHLARKGRFGIGRRPSAHPVANDTHVVIPTSHQNAVQGWGDDLRSRGTALAPLNWTYPAHFTGEEVKFEMVRHMPIADVESVYVVSNNNYFYGIDAQTGEFRFRTDLGRGGVIRTAPVMKNDIIYIGTNTQLFAVDRSGKILWTYTTDGPVEGQIFAMDDRVYYNTVKVSVTGVTGDKYKDLMLGRTTEQATRVHVEAAPDIMASIRFTQRQAPNFDKDKYLANDPKPWRVDDKGKVSYDVDVIEPPRHTDWEIPNKGQRVIMKTKKYVFVMYEEWHVPYSKEQQSELIKQGKVAKESEFRIYTQRVLQCLDVDTGLVHESGGERWSWNVADFPFIVGSMDETDRAIYFCTKDGHLFKGFAVE